VKLLRRNLDILDHLLEASSICPDIPLEKKTKVEVAKERRIRKILGPMAWGYYNLTQGHCLKGIGQLC